jgi:hypothetical protein
MDVGGSLRKHFGAPNAVDMPRLRSVQSLPEDAESFAPLGHTLSGGFFYLKPIPIPIVVIPIPITVILSEVKDLDNGR